MILFVITSVIYEWVLEESFKDQTQQKLKRRRDETEPGRKKAMA